MQEHQPDTSGEYVDRGPRRCTTLDRAFEDETTGLHRLRDLDPGERTTRRIPTPEEDALLRRIYAEYRDQLQALGANLIESDFYSAPRSALQVTA